MDAPSAAEPPPADQVQGLKHFARLLPLLRRLHTIGCGRDKAGNRQLFFDDYVILILLALFNPLIAALRQLQHVLELPHVARKLGIRRFSLGSFSEAPAVFEPQAMLPIIQDLGAELKPLTQDPRFAELKDAITLVDSSLLSGLPRLAAAAGEATRYTTTRDGRGLYGWRLHLQLDLKTFAPHRVDRTGGRNAGDSAERAVLRRSLEPGRCYVGDGGYGDATLFDAITDIGSSYVVRLREVSVFDVIEERPLSEEALEAGVTRDAIVRWGDGRHPVRIVEVQVRTHPQRRRRGAQETDRLVLATNLLDLPAELVALIYQHRYAVELFFRFLKQLLGLRHLLSERPAGVDIEIYCAVIACLLISLESGRRPNKYMATMMSWYLLGLASEEDVVAFVNRPDNRGVKLRAEEELWKKLLG